MKPWYRTQDKAIQVSCPRCLRSGRRGGVAKFAGEAMARQFSTWFRRHRNHDG